MKFIKLLFAVFLSLGLFLVHSSPAAASGDYATKVHLSGASVIAEDANGRALASGAAGYDDASVINAALSRGGTCYIAGGVYVLRAAVEPVSNSVVRGDGTATVLKWADNLITFYNATVPGSVSPIGVYPPEILVNYKVNVTIEDLKTDGNQENNVIKEKQGEGGYPGIMVKDSADVTVRNVVIYNPFGTGFNGHKSMRLRLDNVTMSSNGAVTGNPVTSEGGMYDSGLSIGGVSYSVFNNITIRDFATNIEMYGLGEPPSGDYCGNDMNPNCDNKYDNFTNIYLAKTGVNFLDSHWFYWFWSKSNFHTIFYNVTCVIEDPAQKVAMWAFQQSQDFTMRNAYIEGGNNIAGETMRFDPDTADGYMVRNVLLDNVSIKGINKGIALRNYSNVVIKNSHFIGFGGPEGTFIYSYGNGTGDYGDYGLTVENNVFSAIQHPEQSHYSIYLGPRVKYAKIIGNSFTTPVNSIGIDPGASELTLSDNVGNSATMSGASMPKIACYGEGLTGMGWYCNNYLGGHGPYETHTYNVANGTTGDLIGSAKSGEGKGYQYAVVLAGTNDIKQGLPLAATYENLDKVVQQLTNDGQEVILSTMPPCNISGLCSADQSEVKSLNSVIRRISFAKNLCYADIFDAVFTGVFHGDWFYNYDSCYYSYPNIGCQVAMAAVYDRAIKDCRPFDCDAYPQDCYPATTSTSTTITTTTTTTTTLAHRDGDADGDGHVNYEDLIILAASYGKSTAQAGFDPRADFNSDGVVDYDDLILLAADYGA